jgi:hypothetical protein
MVDGHPDVYADQVALTIGPFGCALNFALSPAIPPTIQTAVQGQPMATVRMSLEHLKLMAFMLRHQLAKYEQERGIRVPVPRDVLNQLRIGLEDWQECWRGDAQ